MKYKIIDLMNQPSYQPLDINQIYKELKLTSSTDFTQLAKTLNSLVDQNIIIYNKKGEFAPINYYQLEKGIIDVKDAGYAFLDTENFSIFIPKSKLKGAITNDEVMVKYQIDKKGRYEGEVTRIIQRNNQDIVGTLYQKKGKFIVKPIDTKINLTIYILPKDLLNAEENDFVRTKITAFYKNNTADAIITKVIGNKKTPGSDITSLVISSNIKQEFSCETLDEIKDIPESVDATKELNEDFLRKDFRDKTIITIDGDDAKDLDDAISIKLLDNGNYLLGVYIADVSHYVKEQSFIDLDALNRGTSIYLPDRVIPMLPKKLSNGICSLNENVDRLVMYCQMEIDSLGEVLSYEIGEAIIKNTHRMTYQVVNQILEDENQELIKKYYDIYPMLLDMQKLAKILNLMRIKRGSFEFESIEPKLILDEQGKVYKIELRIQKTAENIIEEFMLIANETVATALSWQDIPFIYRVHEQPNQEKMIKLLYSLDQFGYRVKVKNQKQLPKALQQLLLDMKDETKTEQERTNDAIISRLMIRSMAKAKYQEQNIGHYGLQSKCYTHFTSPIRRYPDLLVHRLIKEFMLGKKETSSSNPLLYFTQKVNQACTLANITEKNADTLERNCIDLKKVEYMSNFIGQTFSGLISSITNFGVFIMLENTVEGLVKFEDMYDDYYIVDELKGMIIGEKKGKKYQIGDNVIIRVMKTDLDKRIVEFRLLGKDK